MLNWLTRTFSSSIGKKYLVAATGGGLIMFLIVHMAGNLTLFVNDDGAAFNAYAHALEANPVLPVMEVGLLAMLAFHIALAVHVTRQNREARPTGYRVRTSMGKSTPGSRSMIVTGVLLLVFIAIHLWDFRIPTWFGEPDGGSLAGMVKARLATPVGMLVYTFGAIVLGLHLSHGASSVFQSLGIHHPRYEALLRNAGLALAVLLGVGFLSFPIVIFFFRS